MRIITNLSCCRLPANGSLRPVFIFFTVNDGQNFAGQKEGFVNIVGYVNDGNGRFFLRFFNS